MKLSGLIAAYGDDNVQFQNLDTCAQTLNYHHKKGTTITFGAEGNILNATGTEKLGLVVWMDRDRVKEIMDAAKSPV